ncbi:acetate uptake transporter [Chloroflexota bacterium]
MEKEVLEIHSIKDTTANPAPLGLLAFGMTTVLLNLYNAGAYTLGTMILGMGLFYGGLAQVIVGIMEWKKGNTFGTLAFTSYGLFWLSFVFLKIGGNLNWFAAPEIGAVVAYLVIWGIFTAVMFFGTLKSNRALQFVFASLATLFFLLAIADATGAGWVMTLAGIEGVICGASAMYTGLAITLNEIYDREVLPLWHVKR